MVPRRLFSVPAAVLVALVISTAGQVSSAARAQAAGGLAVDKLVTTHATQSSTSVTSPAFTTSQAGELVLAFIASDGPATPTQTITGVSGGGLTWRLRQRTNAQLGTAEVWQAVASTVLTNVTVRATHSGSYQASITVATFTGADLTVDGAVKGASASSGAPSAQLTTTRAGSWVWGVGNDYDRAVSRTVGSGQTKVDEYLASSGDTMWVQRQSATTAASGAVVPINDTAPTNDRWNLSIIEVPAALVDTSPPTAPTGLAATAPGPTRVDLTWTASTDDTGVVGYRVLRDGAQVGTSTATSYSDTTTQASTSYSYTVRAVDGAGNVSPDSLPATVTTPAADTVPPTVSVTGPADGATVSGTVAVTADAADATGVVGVLFAVDGTTLGTEDTVAPYSVPWSTTTVADGSHVVSATARDAAGNTATASVTVTVGNAGSDPAVVGSWGAVQSWPEVSIHAALTDTGKVLTWQGDFSQGGQQYLLDPSTGATTQVPNAAADLFCAGQAVLADGRILVVGGTATNGGLGITTVTAFNPSTGTWQTLAPMHHPRWYPTATTLADGRVLVTSGANTSSTDIVQVPEVYDPRTNTWTDLTTATRNIPYYPFVYQLPDGRVLQSGASEEPTSTIALDPATQQWSTLDSRALDAASITNYAPGKFLKAGSASDGGFSGQSVATAYTLDLNQAGATWQPTQSMAYARSFVNLTTLPDGTVLATGGGTDKSGQNTANAVMPAEVWNPATGTWRTVASMSVPRLYHSVAVLLPDGRVFVSGSGGDTGVDDQKSYQLYSPSYLFKGARPTITSAPSSLQYGGSAFVQTPDAAGIASVSLIRTGSVTHSFDQNARAMQLPFTRTSDGISVQLPASGNTAPPGYYMLFIVNGNGVPSVAAMTRFPAPSEDTVAPTAPGGLTATGGVGHIDLSWTASTDDVGVTRYDVYRSTTSGFVAGPTTQVAQVSGTTTTYRDPGLSAGTYYYVVKAEDAAANLSPPSPQAGATATADTTAPTAPTNLVATPSAGQVALTWTASTDDVGVTRYTVLRGGTPLASTTGTSYADTAVIAGATYTYAVTAQDAAGNVSDPSVPVSTTVPTAPAAITVDKVVSVHRGTAATSVAATGVTTTGSQELLLAFLSSDGPSGGGSAKFASVSGGGLTWTLRQRANAQPGTAEVWQAVAPAPLTNATVTATQASGSWQSSITVVGFLGADTSTGAATATSATTGAPMATLTTTRAGSWVWGVGTDWSTATSRTVGAGQTLVDQYLAPAGDTYWVQRQSAPTAASGTAVTINDTAPTADKYDLAVVEVLAAP